MAKYILKDYKGCEEGEEPNITILKNKNELIYKLLGYLDDDITLQVRK